MLRQFLVSGFMVVGVMSTLLNAPRIGTTLVSVDGADSDALLAMASSDVVVWLVSAFFLLGALGAMLCKERRHFRSVLAYLSPLFLMALAAAFLEGLPTNRGRAFAVLSVTLTTVTLCSPWLIVWYQLLLPPPDVKDPEHRRQQA